MTACLLYAKIHKNKAENLLHLMLYFSKFTKKCKIGCVLVQNVVSYKGVQK